MLRAMSLVTTRCSIAAPYVKGKIAIRRFAEPKLADGQIRPAAKTITDPKAAILRDIILLFSSN
jgi:hypothetical protein